MALITPKWVDVWKNKLEIKASTNSSSLFVENPVLLKSRVQGEYFQY